MDFNSLSVSRKLILGSAAAMVISLFMPWVDLKFMSASGMQQDGYLFLIVFAYPVYAILKDEAIKSPAVNFGVAIFNSILVFLFMQSKKISEMGIEINVIGSGLYVAFIASVLLAVGLFMYMKEEK